MNIWGHFGGFRTKMGSGKNIEKKKTHARLAVGGVLSIYAFDLSLSADHVSSSSISLSSDECYMLLF